VEELKFKFFYRLKMGITYVREYHSDVEVKMSRKFEGREGILKGYLVVETGYLGNEKVSFTTYFYSDKKYLHGPSVKFKEGKIESWSKYYLDQLLCQCYA